MLHVALSLDFIGKPFVGLYFIICKIYFILIIEQADKFKEITHQHDVWHEGKNLAKKINAVCLHNL